MAYSTLTDLQKLIPTASLVTLSNDTAGAVAVDQTNIDEAIDQADREIDAYLVIAGYSVPMDPVPPLVTNLSAKMAIWHLHLRKYFESKIWRDTYKDCQHLLGRIASGDLSIGMAVSGVATAAGTGMVASSRTRKFTEEFMEQF